MSIQNTLYAKALFSSEVLTLLLIGCFFTLISGRGGGGGLNESTFFELVKKKFFSPRLYPLLRHP